MNDHMKHKVGATHGSVVPTPERVQARGSYDPAAPTGAADTRAAIESPIIDDVLDVKGATHLLRMGRNTIYELVGRNKIPHRRLGKQIRFSRAAIMRWLDSCWLQDAKERQ